MKYLSHDPHPSEKRPVANDALTVKSARDTSPLAETEMCEPIILF